MVSFFVVNVWAANVGAGSKTVVLLLTISVFAAHLPKMISLFFGTDTDFRAEDDPWAPGKFRIPRICVSVTIIFAVVFI